MRKISILIICVSFATLHGQASNVTIQTFSNYKQWNWDTTIVMQNGIITMATVPAIGARMMQYDLGSLPSLMVNPNLFGQEPKPSSGGYYNFGGYKTWPSPQGRWPGSWPPPPTLDYGVYAVLETNQTNDSVSLSVLSPIEKWVAANIQFKRRATIYLGTSRIRMEQSIINNGTNEVDWGMWSIAQTIVNHTGETDFSNFWAFFPINPNSIYGKSGVSLPDGDCVAWKGEVAPGVYGVQFSPMDPYGKKILADSDKGWIAYASILDTVVFARTFPIFEGMQYPDGGARTTVYVSSNSAPRYFEVEVKSPVVTLEANGGCYTFTEDWWAAKVQAPILDVNSVGAIAHRLSYDTTTQSLLGIYGVFYTGMAKIAFMDAQGQLLSEGQPHPVTPLAQFRLQESIGIPNEAKTVEIRIYNTKNELMGVLESSDVSVLLTAVEATNTVIASEYSLAQNYPNPFNPSTMFRFGLPQESRVKLSIYNILGQKVDLLVDETMSSGYHNVVWDATKYSSGVYMYRIDATSTSDNKSWTQTKKMIFIK